MIFSKDKDIDRMTAAMMTELTTIYKTKSSDEYKMAGDITKSPMYEKIEQMLANLNLLKHFNKNEAKDLHSLFNVLHRPIFKKSVTQYVHEPNETNIMFTVVFTTGYRMLIAELSRIFACTEATDKGIVYKPNKIFESSDAMKLIKAYNNDIETKLDRYIRAHMNTPVQEAWSSIVGAGVEVLKFIKSKELIEWGAVFSDLFNAIFGSARELNPLSFIDDVLSESYDRKVQEFDNVCDNYQATKDAYEEYIRIPEAQRDKKVESRYLKDMEKYNIRMQNIQAKIKHYDQRAAEESKELADKIKIEKTDDTKTSDNTKNDTSGDDFDNFDF